MTTTQHSKLAKIQARRRAQQLPRPDAAGADESFRKLQDAVRRAKEDREWNEQQAKNRKNWLSYVLEIVAVFFGSAVATYAIKLIIG